MELHRILIGGGSMLAGILLFIFSKRIGNWLQRKFTKEVEEE